LALMELGVAWAVVVVEGIREVVMFGCAIFGVNEAMYSVSFGLWEMGER
jgi:hypothetical protein